MPRRISQASALISATSRKEKSGASLQTCIVHLIRNSLDYASWKDRRGLAAALKPIYTAPSAEAALAELDAFERGPWGGSLPTMVAAWRQARGVILFFTFPPAILRLLPIFSRDSRWLSP